MIRMVSMGSATAGGGASELRSTATRTAARRTRTISGLIVRRGPAGGAWTAEVAGPMVSGDATGFIRRRLLVAQATELPLPGVELGDRLDQVRLLEVRPEGFREVEFGIRRFPDQEIRKALFSGGANDKVRLGQVGMVEGVADVLVGESLGVYPCGQKRLDRVDDLGAAPVVDQQVQHPPLVGTGQRLGGLDLAKQLHRQPIAPPRDAELHALAVELFDLAIQCLREEAHQAVDLGARPGPVLG